MLQGAEDHGGADRRECTVAALLLPVNFEQVYAAYREQLAKQQQQQPAKPSTQRQSRHYHNCN